MNRINPSNNAPEAPETPTFKPAVLAAMREFRTQKPWRGTIEERLAKFQAVHGALSAAYESDWTLVFKPTGRGCCGAKREAKEIYLIGKFSVVTYLFVFAAVNIYGGNCAKARDWSVALYKRIFPLSAARMTYAANGMVLNPGENNLN